MKAVPKPEEKGAQKPSPPSPAAPSSVSPPPCSAGKVAAASMGAPPFTGSDTKSKAVVGGAASAGGVKLPAPDKIHDMAKQQSKKMWFLTTDAEVEDFFQTSCRCKIVMFYRPDCGWCQWFCPFYIELAPTQEFFATYMKTHTEPPFMIAMAPTGASTLSMVKDLVGGAKDMMGVPYIRVLESDAKGKVVKNSKTNGQTLVQLFTELPKLCLDPDANPMRDKTFFSFDTSTFPAEFDRLAIEKRDASRKLQVQKAQQQVQQQVSQPSPQDKKRVHIRRVSPSSLSVSKPAVDRWPETDSDMRAFVADWKSGGTSGGGEKKKGGGAPTTLIVYFYQADQDTTPLHLACSTILTFLKATYGTDCPIYRREVIDPLPVSPTLRLSSKDKLGNEKVKKELASIDVVTYLQKLEKTIKQSKSDVQKQLSRFTPQTSLS